MGNSKSTDKVKEPVRIRFKDLASGDKSIYFDINVHGQRSYQFLNLRIHEGETKEIADRNAEIMHYVEAQKNALVNELTLDKAKDIDRSFAFDITFSELTHVFENTMQEKWTAKTLGLKQALHARFSEFFGDMLLKDITTEKISEYVTTLKENPLMTNPKKKMAGATIVTFIKQLSTIFKFAVQERLIDKDPCCDLAYQVEVPEKILDYLDMRELRTLIETPTTVPSLKRIFLFICFTGIHEIDAMNLCWRNVLWKGKDCYVNFKSRKYGIDMELPLCQMAIKCLPTKGTDDELLFPFSFGSKNINFIRWQEKAMIGKKLNMSLARNTFAIMLLKSGVDDFTVAHMLGLSAVKNIEPYKRALKYREKGGLM